MKITFENLDWTKIQVSVRRLVSDEGIEIVISPLAEKNWSIGYYAYGAGGCRIELNNLENDSQFGCVSIQGVSVKEKSSFDNDIALTRNEDDDEVFIFINKKHLETDQKSFVFYRNTAI